MGVKQMGPMWGQGERTQGSLGQAESRIPPRTTAEGETSGGGVGDLDFTLRKLR